MYNGDISDKEKVIAAQSLMQLSCSRLGEFERTKADENSNYTFVSHSLELESTQPTAYTVARFLIDLQQAQDPVDLFPMYDDDSSRPLPNYSTFGSCAKSQCRKLESDTFIFETNFSSDEDKRYKCHYKGCGKMYGKSSHLKAHLRTHTGDFIIIQMNTNLRNFCS